MSWNTKFSKPKEENKVKFKPKHKGTPKKISETKWKAKESAKNLGIDDEPT